MRKLLLTIFLASSPCWGSWGYYRSFTLGKATNTDQTNFRLAFRFDNTNSGTSFKSSGGRIQHTGTQTGGKAITIPYDLVFGTNSSCSSPITAIDYDTYDGATPVLTGFVTVPSLTTATNAVIYVCYGDASVSTQQNVPGNTCTGCGAIVHMGDSSTLSLEESANGLTMTNNGTSTAAAGQINGAVSLNGTSQYLSHASATQYNLTDYKVSAWVYSMSWGGCTQQCTVASHSPASASAGHWSFYVGLDGKLKMDIPFVVGSVLSGSTFISTSTWHWIALTKTGNTYTSYIDGTQESTTSNSSAPTVSGQFNIGSYIYSSAQYFNGRIDEVQYEPYRSADWIATEYANQFNPLTFSTLGSEQTGSTAKPAHRVIVQ